MNPCLLRWFATATCALSLAACVAPPETIDRTPRPEAFARALTDASSRSGETLTVPRADAPAAEPIVLRLSLAGCIELAQQHNRDLLIESIALRTAEASRLQELAFTDITLRAGASVSRNERAIQSRFVGDTRTTSEETQQNYNAGVTVPFFSGTTLGASHTVSRTTTNSPFNNFEWNSALELSVTQRLLDGFGFVANRTGLEVAELEQAATTADIGNRTVQIRYDVCDAYWQLVLAREDLAVLVAQLEAARAGLDRDERREREGLATRLDVLRARSTVKQRERDIIQAELEVDRRSDALLRAIHPDLLYGYTLQSGFRISVEPRERLGDEVTEASPPNLQTELALAFSQRTDLKAALHRLEASGLRVRQRRQSLLPLLDLELTGRLEGLDDDYAKTLEKISEADSRELRGGLTFEVPLGNTADQANLDRAIAERDQALLRAREAEVTVIADVVEAAREIASQQRSVVAAREARDLAEEEFNATRVRLDAGVGTSFEVKEAESARTSAQRDYVRARVELQLARLRLQRATGTLK